MNTCLNSYLLEWLLGIQKGANVKHCRIKLIVLTWPGTSSGPRVIPVTLDRYVISSYLIPYNSHKLN